MARRSSTFSSEENIDARDTIGPAHARFPRAFVLAVALMLFVEIIVRQSGWPTRIPYELGRAEYYADKTQLDVGSPGEVSIIGSSRTRESLVLPQLAQTLEAALGRPISVRNYASSGAHASDFEALTRRLLREPTPPKLILCGVCERDLFSDGKPWDEVAIFWNLDDWRAKWPERGTQNLDDLPTVVRNWVGDGWRTLGLRAPLALRVRQLAMGNLSVDPPSPVEGGLSMWQRLSPTRTLVKNPIDAKKSNVIQRTRALKVEEFPDPQLRSALHGLAALCRQRGVPLVLYELPMSRMLRRAYPKGLYERYVEEIRVAADENGAQFVPLSALGIDFNDYDMREPSHMSFRGAKRLTEALAAHAVVPALKGK